MSTDITPDTIETATEPADTGSRDVFATYCPEDNKLRLYVGRVPREEYLALRKEGWTALHKQREAGGGDFVATWTPSRRDTALRLCDVILDEDMGPAERAADRAERFGGYRDKRLDDAVGHADRYDAGPAAHGYQSEKRAERAAARHDRIAGRAVDAWDCAEYWQRRTAGVIAHALHVSSPSVRMGRIKEIESEIRKAEKSRAEYQQRREIWQKVAAETDAQRQKARAIAFSGTDSGVSHYIHPRTGRKASLWALLTGHNYSDTPEADTITGAEAAALYLDAHPELAKEGPWLTHYRHRLAYENAMLEAQGGRAGAVEIEVGGWLRGGRRLSNEERQIIKVNRSNATGRVVSVEVRDNRPSSVNHWGNPYPAGVTKTLVHKVEIERASPDCYRPPTDDERAAFVAAVKAKKAAAPKIEFINPTPEDAERLQATLNRQAAAADKGQNYPRQAAEVSPMTQARFSGLYTDYKTTRTMHGVKIRVRLCGWRSVDSVVCLTDKPQKPLPAAFWKALEPEAPAAAPVASPASMSVPAGKAGELFGAATPFALASEVQKAPEPAKAKEAGAEQTEMFATA